MNANELRIGNYVYGASRGLPMLVNIEIIEHLEYYKSGFLPIPLTEDILFKCGFEKDGIGFWYRKNPNVKSRDVWGGWYLNKDGELTVSLGIIHKRVYSLHQLQNLYFALTNEELNINL